jgi:hypothetical protein
MASGRSHPQGMGARLTMPPPPEPPLWRQFVTDALLVFAAVAVIRILLLAIYGFPPHDQTGTPD